MLFHIYFLCTSPRILWCVWFGWKGLFPPAGAFGTKTTVSTCCRRRSTVLENCVSRTKHTHTHTRSRCPKTRKTHIGHENDVSNVNNKVSRYRKVEPRLICKSFLWGGSWPKPQKAAKPSRFGVRNPGQETREESAVGRKRWSLLLLLLRAGCEMAEC